jgi:hypothetical protein
MPGGGDEEGRKKREENEKDGGIYTLRRAFPIGKDQKEYSVQIRHYKH